MKVRIVVDYVPRYRRGHQWHFVPPVTGIHLAAITPPEHEVEVIHEQVRPVPVDTTPDVVALSFFSGFARRAYQLADRYRALGVRVVAGGPHVSYWTEEALEHVDVVVTGEAESVWPEVLRDIERGTPRRVYRGEAVPLAGLPTPRYDLLEDRFLVPRVLQATRGCPFTCSFCTVPDLNPGFRVRPVDEVVRDIATTRFPRFWQDKVAWFWDDNLLVQRRWAKDLLRAMSGLDRWWLTQASIDIVKDRELLDLMERSGCIGIFLGIESLDEADLRSVDKRQNRVREYRDAIERLHDRGICVMAGFISGFDDQTPEAIVATADRLNAVGVDVPFLSVLTPFRGTPLYDEYLRDGRILEDRDWDHYTGYGVAFRPARMTPDELLAAHRRLWNRAFSPALVTDRLARGARQLSRGGMMLSAAMNGFYGLKQLTGNEPARAPIEGEGRIAHPDPMQAPLRLSQIGVRRAERESASRHEKAPSAARTAVA
ncbi:B12-binding domain-containing radical SAM protein [Polyangium aurulentum]|uniref:B12-binding domain-containing radical SAM protein n=1 Tax=Polyangium aurulentum TaxID=2567896 RepID=UPI0010AE1685|nr:radical SAM protein [Polyangium aurulentum]UQA55977.1 B12-binding domain-containing radical SAM protein [Polyangium aurulentum]